MVTQDYLDFSSLVRRYWHCIGRYALLLFIAGAPAVFLLGSDIIFTLYAWVFISIAVTHVLWMVHERSREREDYDKDT